MQLGKRKANTLRTDTTNLQFVKLNTVYTLCKKDNSQKNIHNLFLCSQKSQDHEKLLTAAKLESFQRWVGFFAPCECPLLPFELWDTKRNSHICAPVKEKASESADSTGKPVSSASQSGPCLGLTSRDSYLCDTSLKCVTTIPTPANRLAFRFWN